MRQSGKLGAIMRWSLLLAFLVVAVPAQADETEQKRFANEFIREVSQLVSIRAQALKDFGTNTHDQMMGCVRTDERLQLELGGFINNLKTFKLTGENSESPGLLMRLWGQESQVYEELGNLCETMLAGPKPGIDYGALTASAPKLTARIDYLDETLFQSTPLVVATLISNKPDAKGHVSFLILTKAERDDMVRTLNGSFPEINAKEPKYLTASAQMIREYLTKRGYKMADER